MLLLLLLFIGLCLLLLLLVVVVDAAGHPGRRRLRRPRGQRVRLRGPASLRPAHLPGGVLQKQEHHSN